MAFVLDASITACWILPDEQSAAADAILERLYSEIGGVPALWWYEVRNLLVVNERRGRLSTEASDRALRSLSLLSIDIDFEATGETVLDLARRHRLTFYDAAYLELALRKRVPLATFDEALRSAARAEGVELI